jgi:hypothetical protein
MKIPTNRFLVVAKMPLPVAVLIKFAQALIAAVTGNAHFPNPNPAIADLAKAVDALDAAETATKTRAKGTVAARNAARANLVSMLHAAKAYVQQVADANPDNAQAIITSASFNVRKAPARSKAPFAATQGTTSGVVRLTAKAAAARASYEWEWSADGGKTWTQLPSTLQSKTTVSGLTPATTYQFRYRATTKAGEGDWTQVTSLLVK